MVGTDCMMQLIVRCVCVCVAVTQNEGDFLVRLDGVHVEFVAKGPYSYGACIVEDGG